MNEHEYYCFLKEFWKVTNDGFIIVDPNGVIVDINETYCEFLGKTREQVLGKPIGEVISTTSMYDVLSSARDGDDNVYLQPYGENDNASNVETHAVANRFCFFNEQGELLGAAAQMSFKERAAAMAYSIATEELNYYKRAYEESSEEDSGFRIENTIYIKKYNKMLVFHPTFPPFKKLICLLPLLSHFYMCKNLPIIPF